MTVIRATRQDLALLVPLFDAYRQFYGQTSDPVAAEQFLSDRRRLEQSVIFIAMKDDHASGFVQLYPSFSSVAMQPIWILNDLFVTPLARRHGVASDLMRAVSDFAAESGASRLVLATGNENTVAQSLYRKLGWQPDTTFTHFTRQLT